MRQPEVPAEDPWSSGPYSVIATGDQGPWVRHLPLMWCAVNDPEGGHLPPPGPLAGAASGALTSRIAWWSPLFHLMFYGLGWVRSDVALMRWVAAGRTTQDSVHLSLLDRWWGERIQDALAFVAHSDEFAMVQGKLPRSALPTDERRIPDRWEGRRAEPTWVDEGPAQMHLEHVLTPVGVITDFDRNDDDLLLARTPDPNDPRAVLRLNSYAGWYAALARVGAALPERQDGRSWRIDVYLPQLGFLGTYRRSRLTGRWFSGRHRWHELGVLNPSDLI